MEIEEGILAYLKTRTSLTALVGTSPTRIYPDTFPRGITVTWPAIVYEFVGEETTDTFRQPTTELTGDAIQFSVYAATRSAADAVARQLKAAFKNFSGTMGTVAVQAVEQVNKLKTYDDKVDLYRTTYEFRFWYEEA